MSTSSEHWFRLNDHTLVITIPTGEPLLLLFAFCMPLVCWLVVRCFSAIVGEYAKRAWFNEHRDALKKIKCELISANEELASCNRNISLNKYFIEKLIRENKRLVYEILRLKSLLADKDEKKQNLILNQSHSENTTLITDSD